MVGSISHVALISTLLIIVRKRKKGNNLDNNSEDHSERSQFQINKLHNSMRGGGADWTRELSRSINRMTQDINDQVQRFTQGLHMQIQQQVESSLQPALAEVDRTLQNLPRDAQGRIISTSGNSIIINSGSVTKTILSGHTPNGEPYVRNIEEYYVGNVLYHNETLYNPKTKTSERFRWKLDLATPGATPEPIQDE